MYVDNIHVVQLRETNVIMYVGLERVIGKHKINIYVPCGQCSSFERDECIYVCWSQRVICKHKINIIYVYADNIVQLRVTNVIMYVGHQRVICKHKYECFMYVDNIVQLWEIYIYFDAGL